MPRFSRGRHLFIKCVWQYVRTTVAYKRLYKCIDQRKRCHQNWCTCFPVKSTQKYVHERYRRTKNLENFWIYLRSSIQITCMSVIKRNKLVIFSQLINLNTSALTGNGWHSTSNDPPCDGHFSWTLSSA